MSCRDCRWFYLKIDEYKVKIPWCDRWDKPIDKVEDCYILEEMDK